MIITSSLEDRTGLAADGNIVNNGSASLIATIKSFSFLHEIRTLASLCLDKWINNPGKNNNLYFY